MERRAEDSAEFVASAVASEPETACEALEGLVLLSFLKRALAVFLQALHTKDKGSIALEAQDA